jgi:hypothetical protein
MWVANQIVARARPGLLEEATRIIVNIALERIPTSNCPRFSW